MGYRCPRFIPIKKVIIPYEGEDFTFYHTNYIAQEEVISKLSDAELDLLQTLARKEEGRRILEKQSKASEEKSQTKN